MPEFIGQLPISEPAWNKTSSVQSFQRYDRGIRFNCGNNSLLILTILANNLIRVRFSPSGELTPRRSWAVNLPDEQWNAVNFDIQEADEQIIIETEKIKVCVQKNPCQIKCFDKAGNAFAHDTGLGIASRKGEIVNWKEITPQEKFYGFGERSGLLNQRGKVLTNWTTDSLDYTMLTDEMYQAIPFFMSLRPNVGYGLFFNTTFWSQFDVGADDVNTLQLKTKDSQLDYYIIYGSEPATILKTYTQLTGRMPLPPRWALGYHQCRWSYNSEAEVRELVGQFRKRRIPCDVVHLDIDYMQGFRVFTWNKQRFPSPKMLIEDLSQQGIKVVNIIDPGVKFDPEASYQVCDEGLDKDYFIRRENGKVFHGYVWPDRAVFPDFMRPEVREWWGNLQRNLTDVGVAGIWNDMNEPAMNNQPFGDLEGVKITFEMDASSGSGEDKTTWRETHNLYGMNMARASYEGLQKLRPTQRSFVLTRSGFAGVQRYSAVWTGDNHSKWEYLEMSLPMLCNLGLSGVAFVGADIGGFAGNATPELFARWMQVGILYPLMRGHSMIGTKRHEPWEFGQEVEDICRKYIELRYQLLPYFYTLFWQAASKGEPVLRPLIYQYSHDEKTYEIYDQVLIGNSIMAAPIYRPGVKNRMVYLPEGIWYDWWDRNQIQSHQGSQHILVDAPLEKMPLFIKAGAIIPLIRVMQYAEELPINEMRLLVAPGKGEFTLYEDDGNTFAYRDGASSTTEYKVDFEGNQVVFEIEERQGKLAPSKRKVIVEVIGKGEQEFIDDGEARRLVF
ncbi:MAG: glycoside hydrolase family 31 protein [Cyanobacteria bacterium J06629_18]